LIIADPCRIEGERFDEKEYDNLPTIGVFIEDTSHKSPQGIVCPTGWGDGEYHVFAHYFGNTGKVKKIEIICM
jgi:hypothetical protein